MKAISLWEPWASLIRTGAKTYETRSWGTKYRGKLLICAAKKGLSKSELIHKFCFGSFRRGLAPLIGLPLDLSAQNIQYPDVGIEHLNFGKAVAIVSLVDCIKTDDITLGDIEHEKYFGDYNLGRYAWKLEMVDNTFEPFPVKGRQGFFNVSLPLKLKK